jgi:hypothetical protein
LENFVQSLFLPDLAHNPQFQAIAFAGAALFDGKNRNPTDEF